MNDSWFKVGKSRVEEAQRISKEQRENRAPYRLILKPGESKIVTYIDDEGFNFLEHTVQVGTKWEQHTCVGVNNGCPLCKIGNKPYVITMFTVIEMTKYTDSRGQVVENPIRIHALKPEAAMRLFSKKDHWKGLVGKQIIVNRHTPTDASSGSDFELQLSSNLQPIVYDKNKLLEKYKPVDYKKVFSPRPPDVTAQMCNISVPINYQKQETNYAKNTNVSGLSGLEQIDPATISALTQDDDVPF